MPREACACNIKPSSTYSLLLFAAQKHVVGWVYWCSWLGFTISYLFQLFCFHLGWSKGARIFTRGVDICSCFSRARDCFQWQVRQRWHTVNAQCHWQDKLLCFDVEQKGWSSEVTVEVDLFYLISRPLTSSFSVSVCMCLCLWSYVEETITIEHGLAVGCWNHRHAAFNLFLQKIRSSISDAHRAWLLTHAKYWSAWRT